MQVSKKHRLQNAAARIRKEVDTVIGLKYFAAKEKERREIVKTRESKRKTIVSSSHLLLRYMYSIRYNIHT